MLANRVRMVAVMLCLLAAVACAQDKEVIRLWEGDAPDAHGKEPTDIPDLTVFNPPEGKANGSALIICPGGGYEHLSAREGAGYAEYFITKGITCFVLKYRLVKNDYHYPAIYLDVARAVRLVRSQAEGRKLDPKRIAIIGSSAGGHLVSMAVTKFDDGKPDATDPIDRVSSRPDLGILCYPVITMGPKTHMGSRGNLIGTKPSEELVKEVSSELQVTDKTPSCFLWHTFEDKVVVVDNSLMFAQALADKRIPFELHVYQPGGHGMGLGQKVKQGEVLPWADALMNWLKLQKFVD